MYYNLKDTYILHLIFYISVVKRNNCTDYDLQLNNTSWNKTIPFTFKACTKQFQT